MSQVFRTQRRVEFRDTDAAGIMHFSTFFLRMEEAEHAFLRSVGLSVWQEDADGKLSWPRVSAACDYTGAVRFEQLLDIEVRLARLGDKSATYSFRFTCDGRDVATGTMTSVCCRITPNQRPRSVPIPDSLRRILLPFVSTESHDSHETAPPPVSL